AGFCRRSSMNYETFVRGIKFNWLQPNMAASPFLEANPRFGSGATLELWNTRIPGWGIRRRGNLIELLNIPKMSTLAIACAVDKAVSLMSQQSCFVNVGVWYGFTLLSALINNPNKVC